MTETNEEEGFQNWLKAAFALKITKRGIEDDVHKEIVKAHETYLRDLLKVDQLTTREKCTQCCLQNVLNCRTSGICEDRDGSCIFHRPDLQYRACPKNICQRFATMIWKDHRYKKPSWKNTDSRKWCDHPWEIAKCFMQKEGYTEANSVNDTDLNGLLSVIHNHKSLAKTFDQKLCGQARKEVNRVRHSGNLSLTQQEIDNLFDILVKFLSSSQHDKAREAKEKIEKLKSQSIYEDTEMVMLLQPQDILHVKTRDTLHKLVQVLTNADVSLKTIIYNISKKIQKMKKGENCQDVEYQLKRQCLKEDLLSFNQKHHSTLPLSPLYEKTDTPLLGFYVPPPIMAVDFPMSKSRRTDIKTPISSLKDVFKARRSGEIYVTSEAGLGKTAFCKRMVVAWCHAWGKQKKIEKYYEGFLEDVDAMKNFEFLFFVRLRDVLPSQCVIDDMVQHQVIRNLGREKKYDDSFMQDILTSESCLIVIDGIDEWTHPPSKSDCKTVNDIPHRKARQNCTIVSTIRTWKFCMLNLSTNQIHLLVQISELNEQSSKQLVQNAISALDPTESKVAKKSHANFQEKFRNCNIGRLRAIPMILMFLTCLWKEGKSIGDSVCAVYSNIIGLLLQRAERRTNTDKQKFLSKRKINGRHDIPKAIANNPVCLEYSDVLTEIGNLAFDTLFIEDYCNQSSLVFNKTEVEKYPGIDLKFCFDAGILSETCEKSLIDREHAKLSFAHKTFHEFFAALYFSQVPDVSGIRNLVLKVCNEIANILSCSDFFNFLTGLSPDRAHTLAEGIGNVISRSTVTKNYRKDTGSWNYFVGYNDKIKKLQSMFVLCNIESLNNGHKLVPFRLEDFIVDIDIQDQQYADVLWKIMEHNKASIKSIKLRDVKVKDQFQKILSQIAGTHTINRIEKIDLKCEIDDASLENVLEAAESTLKCFVVKGGRWFGNKWVNNTNIKLTNKCHQIVWKMQHLQGLYLRNIDMTHGQLETLANSISQRTMIEHVGLGFIRCSTHSESCPGVTLNLSNHTRLKMIELGEVPLNKIHLSTGDLEVCYVGNFSKENILESIFTCLKQAPKLHVFCCGFLQRRCDTESMLQTVPELHNLQHIWLINLSLEENALHKCDYLQHVENIYLMNIVLRCELLDQLIEKLEHVTHTVKVSLSQCDVQPKADFEIWKSKMRESDYFSVLQDDETKEEFLFKTVD